MLDTTQEFRAKQIEIILSKSMEQRARMGAEMIDSVYAIVKNALMEENPHLDGQALIAAVFRRYYSDIFSKDEIDVICAGILAYSSH